MAFNISNLWSRDTIGSGVTAAYDPVGGTKDTLRGLRAGGGSGPHVTTASESFAALTRQQWTNYMNTFVPIENQLIKYATDPGVVSGAMAGASTDVQNSYQSQAGQTARRLSALGTSLTPDEQAAQQRSYGLSKSLADVQGQNTARDLTTQRQQGILGNPAPDVISIGRGSGV